MAYSIQDDLLTQISESELAILTGDPTGTTIDWTKYEFARINADYTIDIYLYGTYNVPFTIEPVYPIIRKLSVDLTLTYLYEAAYKDSAIPNSIVWRRINAIKMLKDLRDGNIVIEDLQRLISPPKSIISNKENNKRIFNKDVLDNLIDEV